MLEHRELRCAMAIAYRTCSCMDDAVDIVRIKFPAEGLTIECLQEEWRSIDCWWENSTGRFEREGRM